MAADKNTPKAAYELAKKTLGEGGKRFWEWYPSGKVDWCCIAVMYWYKKAAPKLMPIKTAWVPTVQEYGEKHWTHVKMANAKPGDIVIFTWSGRGYNSAPKGVSRDHIGLIRKKSGSSKLVYTIEGNTGSIYPASSKVKNMTREACYIHSIYRPPTPKTAESYTKNDKKDTGTKTNPEGPKTIDCFYKVVEKDGMMIRKGPGVNFKAVGTVGVGKKFRCTKKDGNWVYSPTLKGWVCVKIGKSTYLKKV